MLEIKNISFGYNKQTIIHDINFCIEKGQNLAIIGESGCGKSTLLKLIYGLYDLDKGNIFYDKKSILGPKYILIPGEDYIKYLSQDFDLMPFVTVGENVGKFLSNIYKEKKQARISELLEIVEMSEFINTKAKFLSGGQMQRVAIARVLALEPEILLLDEPFSHIDNFRKNTLRRKLFAYLKQKNITCLVATHDSTDVLSFSDEVLVMQNGKILELGKPKTIYSNPNNKYTASLFEDVNEIPSKYFGYKQENRNLFIYPHQLKIVDNSELKVSVFQSYYRGNHYLIEAQYENGILFFESKIDYEKNKLLFLKL